jgi:hypothetical protein
MRDVTPWGNGADFDLVILRSAFEAVDLDPPYAFHRVRCFRTVKSLFKVKKPERIGVHHNALDDALHQIRHLQEICRQHGVKLT